MKRAAVLLSATIASLAAASSLPALAENWPQFRGAMGQGISRETGVPVKWSETEKIAWKTPIPYAGWSSPIVFGARVFVSGTSADGVSCHVVCLDRLTGKIMWDREVFKQTPGVCDGRNSHATSTPVTDGERVYAFFSSTSAAAVTFDGKVAWTNRDIKFHAIYGLASSPIQYKDLLIMNFDGTDPETDDGHTRAWDKSYVLALDKATGKEKWKAMRGMSRVAYSTPIVVDSGGSPQLISCAGDIVQALNPLTGGKILVGHPPRRGPGAVAGVGRRNGLCHLGIPYRRAGGRGGASVSSRRQRRCYDDSFGLVAPTRHVEDPVHGFRQPRAVPDSRKRRTDVHERHQRRRSLAGTSARPVLGVARLGGRKGLFPIGAREDNGR